MARGQAPTAELTFEYTDEWRYERFITMIEQRAGISWVKAERAARATLETLGERITPDEVRKLSEDVPFQIRMWLNSAGGEAESFDAEEFVRRVAELEQVDLEAAQAHARAVLIALSRLVRGEEFASLEHRLSHDYERLLGEASKRRRDAGAPEIVGVEAFAKRVSSRTGLSIAGSRRATEAVLETLAERIAGGEVDDLELQLPEELRAPLERGKEQSHGKAQRISLDEFVARVAEREGVEYEQALDHARAVFAALRETLTDKEFSDVLAELPRGYYEALL